MQTNDVERLKAEIRYLRNCLLESYNALPTLPCTSLESWSVVSPIMRGIRVYDTSFDEEFTEQKVAKRRRKVSAVLSIDAANRPAAMRIEMAEKPSEPMRVDSKVKSAAKSVGFVLD
jgi:hypothetical protein